MKRLSIGNFQEVGLNTDITADALPPSALTTLRNARIFSNRIVTFGGNREVSTAPVAFTPGHILYVPSSNGAYWVVCGIGMAGTPDDRAVYSYVDATDAWTDISDASIYENLTNVVNWTSCLFNNIPVINHPQSYPQAQDSLAYNADFSQLTWDGVNSWATEQKQCNAIASHKNFLFAMGMIEGGTDYPYVVRWSDAADVGALPGTWDETDPTNLAGKVALSGDGGEIMCGLTLRDSFLVYRETSIHVFDYIGGEFVFSIRDLSPTIGASSRHAVTEFNGLHYFMSKSDIYVTDGNSIKSILNDKIRLEYLFSIGQIDMTRYFVFKNPTLSEIWFCAPIGSTNTNVAFVYNVIKETFSIVDLPETYHIADGHVSEAALTWSTVATTWESEFGSWLVNTNSDTISTAYGFAVQSGATAPKLLELDMIGFLNVAHNPVIERIGLDFEDGDSVTVLEWIPAISIGHDIDFQIGTQEYHNGPITWNPVQTFSEGMRKLDIRATGKLISYRISSSVEGSWWLTGMKFGYEMDGLR